MAKTGGRVGQPKEKRENECISRGQQTGRGASQPKEKREHEWISRGYKQGAGQANLKKKEKTNGLVGAKKGGPRGPT